MGSDNSLSSNLGDGTRIVLFILPSLAGGGAERTFVNIANHLDRKRFRPVVSFFRKEGPFLDLLHEDVELRPLECSRARLSVLRLAQLIRALQPHVVFSTLRYVNAAAVLSGVLARTRAGVLVNETNHWTAAGVKTGSWREQLVRWSYYRARKVVAMSNGVREDVIRRYGIPPEQVVTIYNPIDLSEIAQLMQDPVDALGFGENAEREKHFQIIAAGALERQKGYDLLIKAVARLNHIPYQLSILGEGSQEKNLKKLAQDLRIEDRVRFMGFQKNPYAWMARSDLFVLSSRWEGFGNVIVEAMACGVPVLAARCPAGPDEIISNDADGCLCEPESVDALAYYIEELWRDPERRSRYARVAQESVRRFDVGIIVRDYERLFCEVAP
ncbi:MAG: glycosyltransferase [Verrucomicrobia bacterium]|nr:glycosyltransferase [Verrucomicrobiota bacterium]